MITTFIHLKWSICSIRWDKSTKTNTKGSRTRLPNPRAACSLGSCFKWPAM